MPVNLEYPGAECPVCQEPIPDEAETGDACENCDYVFQAPRPVTSAVRESFDHLRTWTEGDYRLELYDTFRSHRYGQSLLAYEFFHQDTLIFSGDQYGCSPMHAIDGDESVAGLLAFLALRPGDTDAEYFDDYTPAQLEFANHHGEDLSCYVEELEGTAGR